MQIQKRTDTSFGNPVMGRREMTLRQASHRERVHGAKSSIDTRAPAAQPHLTLYGRDYAAKKKATTEAAFMDLKMIQAIARTMTRKTEVEQRKGPVSLNADGRKAEIYRVMSENHRLLEGIENCSPCMRTSDMVRDHKEKTRYIINSSHTMRLSGEYDMEMARIKREDAARFDQKKAGTESRLMAARMRNTTGTVSLPSLTGGGPDFDGEQPRPAPLSRSAGATSSFSGGSKAGKTKAAQGEVIPSPGPPPQRRQQTSGKEPAQNVTADQNRSTDTKDRVPRSSPKRVPSKKGASKEPPAESEPAPAAVAASSGKRASVTFIATADEGSDADGGDSNPRRGRRLSTPHHTMQPLFPAGHEPEVHADEEPKVEAEPTEDARPASGLTDQAEPVDITAQEMELAPAQPAVAEEAPASSGDAEVDDATAVDEAIAAFELAESMPEMDQTEVVNILVSALQRPSTKPRVSTILVAHGWNGSGFESPPDFHSVLLQLQTAKAEVAADDAIAAVEHAENSSGVDELKVVTTLCQELSHPARASRRISAVLEANGWKDDAGFGALPDLHQLHEQLEHARAELKHPEVGQQEEEQKTSADEAAPGGDEPAKQDDVALGDAFEDEYEDEFIDASADSLNMSRTLKSQDPEAANDAFEESATFEDDTTAQADIG